MPHRVTASLAFRMLQESTHKLELPVTFRAQVATVIADIPLGSMMLPRTAVDVPETNARLAGSLFQVQDHGGFGPKCAWTRIALVSFAKMRGFVLL